MITILYKRSMCMCWCVILSLLKIINTHLPETMVFSPLVYWLLCQLMSFFVFSCVPYWTLRHHLLLLPLHWSDPINNDDDTLQNVLHTYTHACTRMRTNTHYTHTFLSSCSSSTTSSSGGWVAMTLEVAWGDKGRVVSASGNGDRNLVTAAFDRSYNNQITTSVS